MNRFFVSGAMSSLNDFSFISAPEWLTKSLHLTNSLTAFENKSVHFYFQSVHFITALTVFQKSVISWFSIKCKLVSEFNNRSYICKNKFYSR